MRRISHKRMTELRNRAYFEMTEEQVAQMDARELASAVMQEVNDYGLLGYNMNIGRVLARKVLQDSANKKGGKK